jgi:hypothetical protein
LFTILPSFLRKQQFSPQLPRAFGINKSSPVAHK